MIVISYLRSLSKQLVSWSKSVKMPLVSNLSLYEVAVFFYHGITEGNLTTRAGSIAYSFFIAIFPGIIFLFSLIPYFPIQGLEQEIFQVFERALPPDTYEAAKSTIDDIISNKRGGLVSFGFLFALLFATNGMRGLLDNFSQTVHSIQERGFWRQQIVSLGLTFVISIFFILGMTLIIFSSKILNQVLSFLQMGNISPFIIETSRLFLLVFLVFLGISLLYNYGAKQGKHWRFFSPGSFLATMLIVLASLGFSFYVSNFAQYNKLYGSIGTVIVILIWIYLNSLVLLIGFELNASISQAKNKNLKKDEN